MKLFRSTSVLFLCLTCVILFGAPDIFAQETQIAKISSESEKVPAEKETVRQNNSPNADLNKNPEDFSVKTSPSAETSRNLMNRVGVQTAQSVPLTLDEAIRKALLNNNDIEVARSDVKIAESNLRSLEGFYDGVFTFAPNYTRSSTTGQAATNDFRVNSDFTKFINVGGGSYRVFFDNARTENRFAQAQASQGGISASGSGALFTSGFGVTYTQPLWRNFKIDNTRRQIKIQRKRVSQSDADFRRQTIQIISAVQQGYWDLVFALRDQQNREANLNLSRENLRRIEAQIDAGIAAPLARAEVATELANRESDLIVATQQVSIAENRLKQLLLKDPQSAEWSSQYVPTDSPVLSNDPVDLTLAMNDAIANRPELRRLKLESEINKIDIDYFKNQTKPRIDLTTTASLEGLANSGTANTDPFTVPLISGDPNLNADAFLLRQIRLLHPGQVEPVPTVTIQPTPSFLVGGFNQALTNIFRSDAPNFSVGLTISFPLRNQTARADLATARFQQERIEAQTRAQEQTVITEVRNAVQAVEAARQRVFAARKARENAEIQLEGERKLFEVGRSTAFLLFQRENALTNARNAEIRAETDYNKALADLQQATSTTFRANNVVIDSPTDEQ